MSFDDEYEEVPEDEISEGGGDLSPNVAEPGELSDGNAELSVSENQGPISGASRSDLSDDAGDGPISSDGEPINPRPNNFGAINGKRRTDRKANAIRFFQTFAANRNRTFEDVARMVGISREVARKYMNELVATVMTSIEAGTYPTGVLLYYNNPAMPKQQRLTVGHLQDLKPVLLRYNSINIDAMLGVTDNLSALSEEPESEVVDDFVKTPFKRFNEFKQNAQNINTNQRVINENSPIQDIIEFGIINAGQPDQARIRRIKTLFMSSPSFYLADEGRFQDLLESNDIKPKTVNTFMNWFKYIAPIKPSERIGFLRLTNHRADTTTYQPEPTQGQGKPFNNFNINDYDEYAQFLYTEGVYRYGLPPEHPENRAAYRRYQEDKKMEEDERRTMRQFNMVMRKNMLEMNPMGGGMMGNRAMPGGIALDENYLIQRGILAPEISYDEHGRKSMRLIPTGRTMYNEPEEKKDSVMESVSTLSRLIEALKPVLAPQAQAPQNPLVDKFLTVAVEKFMGKAEETPSKVLENQMSLFNQFKQMFPMNEQKPLDDKALQLQIELAKINNEKEFSMKEIDIQERHYQLERQRLEEQKNESKDNIGMIMDWVQKGMQYVSPILSQVLMGQFGGGLNSMMPGGMMPPGGMMQAPPQTENNPFMAPPPPQTDTFGTTQPDSFVGPEQFTMPPPPPQEPTYQPQYQPATEPTFQAPPPQYEPPQQQEFYPPPQPEPPSENDFLNNVTLEDLDTMTPDELEEVGSRLESKMEKIERVYNNIKATKAKKQFGYSQPKKQPQPPQPDYSVLDIPATMPQDFDGMPPEPEKKVTVTQTVIEEEPAPSLEDNYSNAVVPTEAEQVMDADTLAYLNSMNAGTDMGSLDFDTFNNDIMEITDNMGNDNQQFNQQNEANQADYIAKQEAIEKEAALQKELARLKALGINPEQQQNNSVPHGDAGKAADSPLNYDQLNNDTALNETKTGPSKQFQKDAEQARKEQDKQAKQGQKTEKRTVEVKTGTDKDKIGAFRQDEKANTNTSTSVGNNQASHKLGDTPSVPQHHDVDNKDDIQSAKDAHQKQDISKDTTGKQKQSEQKPQNKDNKKSF